MSRAAVVSSMSRCTSRASVEGRSFMARSFASCVTHWPASISSTLGNSSVRRDFSYNSVMSLSSCVGAQSEPAER